MAMSYFTKQKLRSMEAELKAAEVDKHESLLVQQLEDVTALIEKCKSFFQEAVAKNRKLVDDLKKQRAEAKNWRVKKRTERKLVIAKESLRKKEEDHATDVMMLKKHLEGMRKKIESAKKDKEKYIAELKKEKAAYEKELKRLETEIKKRAGVRTGVAIGLAVGAVAAVVGGFVAAPIVLAAGAVVAGVAAVTGLLTFLLEK